MPSFGASSLWGREEPFFLRGWLVALALAVIVAAALAGQAGHPDSFSVSRQEDFHGESLLHGLPDDQPALAMPLSSVWDALVQNHASPRARSLLRGLVLGASTVLVFALGRLTHSSACGLLAAAGAVWLGALEPGDFLDEDHLYPLLVLLSAALLAWRARSPGLLRGAAAGLAVGTSLLVRSPLFLFPLLLAAYEWFRPRGGPRRQRARLLAPVVAVPYLLLLPWTMMNWSLEHRFVPFESGRADYNIVAGARGDTLTLDGQGFLMKAGVPAGTSPVLWAAGECLRNPRRTAGAFAARLGFAFRLQPLLSALALASLWVFRRREEHRQVGLLAAYFVLIHCAMAVERSYFTHIWPVLAALAASPLALGLRPRDGDLGERLSVAAAWTCLAPMALLGCFSLLLAAAYPGRAHASPVALDRALSRSPGDPWLLSERGRRRMEAGEPKSAARDFAAAAAIDGRIDRELDYAWALMVAGGPEAYLIDRIHPDERHSAWKVRLLQAIGHALRGHEDRARQAFVSALRTGLSGCRFSGGAAEEETRLDDPLCRDGALSRILDFTRPFPDRRRLDILERFGDYQGEPLLRLAAAELADKAGDGKRALRALAGVKASGLAPEDGLRMAALLARRDERERAAEVLRSLPPEASALPAHSWLDAASVAARADQRDLGRGCLSRAERSGLSPADIAWAARLHTELGDPRGALALLDRLLSRSPLEPELWLGRASAAKAAGDKGMSLDALRRALALSPKPEQERAAALSYQSWGEYARAEDILGRLASRPGPTAAAALSDRGVCRYLRGDKAGAVRDLEAAIARDPRLLPAYSSLAAALTSLGRASEAVAVVDRANKVKDPRDEDRALLEELRRRRGR